MWHGAAVGTGVQQTPRHFAAVLCLHRVNFTISGDHSSLQGERCPCLRTPDEGSSHILRGHVPCAQSVKHAHGHLLCVNGTKMLGGPQMSQSLCLPSRNLWPSCRGKANTGNRQRTILRQLLCISTATTIPLLPLHTFLVLPAPTFQLCIYLRALARLFISKGMIWKTELIFKPSS